MRVKCWLCLLYETVEIIQEIFRKVRNIIKVEGWEKKLKGGI